MIVLDFINLLKTKSSVFIKIKENFKSSHLKYLDFCLLMYSLV